MKETVDVVACVIDRGTFFPVAGQLARGMKKVFYHMPNGESFKKFARGVMGHGHADVHITHDFWKHKEEIDLFVFPDSNCDDIGLQKELKSQGFAVWGSGSASELEEYRGIWIDKAEELNWPMPKTLRIKGLSNLRVFLKENEGETYFIKISRWRGDMETFKADEPTQIRTDLDLLAAKFGPFQDEITFYVQENLDTDIEGGADTYFVGDFPNKIVLGYEKKAQSYFATVKDRKDMPPEIFKPMQEIAPTLDSHGYCNMISSEVRLKDDKSYWLDPCLRFPSPAGEEQLELNKNFPDIVWHGANGQLVQPEIDETFCGEAIIGWTGEKSSWKSFTIPDEVKQWVKLYACAYHDGKYHYGPDQDSEAIGCAVALGHTPSEVLDRLKEIEEALKDAPVQLFITEIADLFKEIEEAEKQGIEFSDKPLPEASEVIESKN